MHPYEIRNSISIKKYVEIKKNYPLLCESFRINIKITSAY